MVVRLIVFFLSSVNLICRTTDISKCFIESLGVRDNESRLYVNIEFDVISFKNLGKILNILQYQMNQLKRFVHTVDFC